MCEDCEAKHAGCGLGTDKKRRWCGACAKAHEGAMYLISGPKMCEDCEAKHAGFGLPAEKKRRWCGACAKSHEGAINLKPSRRARRQMASKQQHKKRTAPDPIRAATRAAAAAVPAIKTEDDGDDVNAELGRRLGTARAEAAAHDAEVAAFGGDQDKVEIKIDKEEIKKEIKKERRDRGHDEAAWRTAARRERVALAMLERGERRERDER